MLTLLGAIRHEAVAQGQAAPNQRRSGAWCYINFSLHNHRGTGKGPFRTDRASNARQGECGGLATTEGPGKVPVDRRLIAALCNAPEFVHSAEVVCRRR
jgi:hypothetical protein